MATHQFIASVTNSNLLIFYLHIAVSWKTAPIYVSHLAHSVAQSLMHYQNVANYDELRLRQLSHNVLVETQPYRTTVDSHRMIKSS